MIPTESRSLFFAQEGTFLRSVPHNNNCSLTLIPYKALYISLKITPHFFVNNS